MNPNALIGKSQHFNMLMSALIYVVSAEFTVSAIEYLLTILNVIEDYV
jgi:hypothetical protein